MLSQLRSGTIGLVLFFLAFFLTDGAAIVPGPTGSRTPDGERLLRSFQRLPLRFEPAGGNPASGAYVARGAGYGLQVDAQGASVVLREPTGSPGTSASRGNVRLALVDPSPETQVIPQAPLPGRTSYFFGNDPRRWAVDVKSYERVRYDEVYPGIDLVYYGNQEQLEFDLLVAPGADVDRIRWRLDGAERVQVDSAGDLVLRTAAGDLRQHRPVVYQEREGRRRPVEGRYVLLASAQGSPTAGIEVGEYDPALPLVIDPVLTFSTYLGGSEGDAGSAIAVDASGCAYVTGYTVSPDFTTTEGALQTSRGANPAQSDVFVTKFDPTGASLIYSTFVGGAGGEEARGIAVDQSGAAFVTGYTRSGNFPTANALYATSRGDADAFVLKLAPAGNALEYSTYLGGLSEEVALGIAVSGEGEACVTGFTRSQNFPVANAFQPLPGSTAQFRDAFVTRFAAAGNSLVYSSYLGGNRTEMLDRGGIAVDESGNVYVAGNTDSGDFPVTAGVLDPTLGGHPGNLDGFVAKITPTGDLAYSTYLGGSANETLYGIAVTSDGEACVTGETASVDFPLVNALRDTYGGSGDSFVTKLTPDAAGLVYSTYLGGSNRDVGHAIAADSSGGVCVVGATFSTNFPIARPLQPPTNNWNAFVTRLSPLGSTFTFSTYVGGDSQDVATGVALDENGETYVTGFTLSAGFPLAAPLDAELGGSVDAFVARISEGAAPPVFPTGLAAISVCNTSASLTWNDNSDDEDAFEIERRTGAQPFAPIGAVPLNNVTFEDQGLQPNTVYVYRVRATSQLGASSYSNELTVTTPLTAVAPPSNLTVTMVSHSSLHVGWQDNSDDETGFRVERSTGGGAFSLVQTVAADVTEFRDTGLEPETEYTYRVRAVAGSCDSAPSPAVAGTTDLAPVPAPTSLISTALSESEIKLTWVDNSQNETGFRVERKVGENFVEEALLLPDTTTYTDTGLAPTTAYVYRVLAVNGDRLSLPTAEARSVTFALPRGILKVKKKINFGTVRLGATKNKVVMIRNGSRVDRMKLTIGDVAPPFTITGNGAHTVLIGGNRTVGLSFTPTVRGKASAKLVLTSSDPKRPRLEITLVGKGR